ncbi:MAG: hypothetical protein CW691_00130 [Candidatus Bathyarchaeum sp.]|nr:MAG: hypothetical protein CW691_00130 [Candidatus Bathyarchaeum sp.]
MKKPKISTIELVFVLIAASTLFMITVHQMSTSGVLPGNDPSVHLAKAKKIIIDEKLSYSEISWYPPFFHTIVAIIQIFAGTTDAMAAAFILKMLIATVNVLLMLSTYLLARKFFGTGTAVASSVFTIMSVPLFEMIFWGGYANFMGLAYIAFIFYIMNKDLGIKVKTFLLFSGTFTLILIHQLTAFVFVLMFVPVFLISSIGSKRKFITFLAVIVGGGLGLLAWYARIIIDYMDIIVEYIFYTVGENYYIISAVTFEALNKNLGITLFITAAGIPLIFIAKKKQTAIRDVVLIIFWLAVPFLLAESYLFGVNLPYDRFVYFFATPITILCGVATYFGISTIPAFIQSKLVPRVTKNLKKINALKIIVIAIICALFAIQASTFLQRIETYPQFYERAPISSYNSGLWVNQHSGTDGTVITPRSPGSWFYIFSDIRTIQETDPLSSRSVVAESVLYSFYEIQKGQTITREFDSVSPSAGQEIHVLRFNLWTKVVSIPNEEVNFIYVDPLGEWIKIPLSESVETIYWTQNSTDKAQVITEYAHKLFTITKTVTVSNSSNLIDINWHVQTHQDLESVKLVVANYLNPALDFKEALIPRVLEWQNPWDNATNINTQEGWAVVEGSDILHENVTAALDAQNGVIAAFEFNETPDWTILGALEDWSIDALRVRYELGYLNEWNSGEASYSVFVHSFDTKEAERWTISELEQQLDTKTKVTPYGRDFLTYIEKYNIKFVAIDTQQVVSNIKATPALDKIYDNGRATVYTTKK